MLERYRDEKSPPEYQPAHSHCFGARPAGIINCVVGATDNALIEIKVRYRSYSKHDRRCICVSRGFHLHATYDSFHSRITHVQSCTTEALHLYGINHTDDSPFMQVVSSGAVFRMLPPRGLDLMDKLTRCIGSGATLTWEKKKGEWVLKELQNVKAYHLWIPRCIRSVLGSTVAWFAPHLNPHAPFFFGPGAPHIHTKAWDLYRDHRNPYGGSGKDDSPSTMQFVRNMFDAELVLCVNCAEPTFSHALRELLPGKRFCDRCIPRSYSIPACTRDTCPFCRETLGLRPERDTCCACKELAVGEFRLFCGCAICVGCLREKLRAPLYLGCQPRGRVRVIVKAFFHTNVLGLLPYDGRKYWIGVCRRE